MWKNYMPLEGQVIYQDLVDFATESEWLRRRYRVTHLEDKDRIRTLIYLRDTPVDSWLPASAFPLFEYEKKSKMFLCKEVLDLPHEKLMLFRNSFITYLRKLDVKHLFQPPAESLYKTGLTKYHDSGEVQIDNVKPKSFTSGFLYQKTMTKHLVTREIWLPDKSTKINNSFWMNIGVQLLRADPRYPSVDPLETLEIIKERLNGVAVFDLPGFGFQYPREYLIIIADVLQSFYPSDFLEEQSNILRLLLTDVKVRMPNGEVLRPPRGIGLGYYESLKTLGILCLVDEFNPISVYGDQGIIPVEHARSVVKKLQDFSFIIDNDRVDIRQNTVKWSGYRMSRRLDFQKPKIVFSKLFGALTSDYHWERKKGLQSFSAEHPDKYAKIEKYVAYQYQRIFGWEFFPGDSLLNFYNLGVTNAPVQEGYKRLTDVEQLVPPGEKDMNIEIFSLPDAKSYSKAEAKDFSIRRKRLFKSTTVKDDLLLLYMKPRILQRNKVKSRAPRGALPLWADLRLLAKFGTTTGRLTSGLDGVDLHYAVKHQCFASDPFGSRANGGYIVLTQYHRQKISSEEAREVASVLQGSEVYGSFNVHRYDQPIEIGYNASSRYRDYSPDIETSTLKPPKRALSINTSSSTKKVIKKRTLLSDNDQIKISKIFESYISTLDSSVSDDLQSIGYPDTESCFGSLRDEEEILAYEDIDCYMSDPLEGLDD